MLLRFIEEEMSLGLLAVEVTVAVVQAEEKHTLLQFVRGMMLDLATGEMMQRQDEEVLVLD